MAQYLVQEYLAARVEEADRTFSFENIDKPNQFYVLVSETHTNRPLVWTIPNFLTSDESDSILEQLEQDKAKENAIFNRKLLLKDAFGENWHDLSQELLPRLRLDYNQHKGLFRRDADTSQEMIHSVDPDWKVVGLETDEELPAHRDGMDSEKKDGIFAVSTHSVLLEFQSKEAPQINLATPKMADGEDASESTESSTSVASLSAEREEEATGGAIRFYYRQYPFDGPYDYCTDVNLPRGWAIVMEQRPDLWYALQPSSSPTTRYVVQTGMLQVLPKGETVESFRKGGRGAFALGPGLLELFEDEVELCLGEVAPRGWGLRGVQPKTTVWRDGFPMIGAQKEVQDLPQARRASSRRRQSLPQGNTGKRMSYVSNAKLLDRDDTSMTADYSESTSRDDDLMPCFIAAMEERKRQEKEFRQRKGIQVTRKPKRDSLVGKMVESFQGS